MRYTLSELAVTHVAMMLHGLGTNSAKYGALSRPDGSVLEQNAGGIMTIKYILAVALITPFLTVSSTAQQYQGGPKSSVPPTMQQIRYGDIYAQGIDVYAPQGDIYAQGVKTNKSHAYRSGPRTVVPHGG